MRGADTPVACVRHRFLLENKESAAFLKPTGYGRSLPCVCRREYPLHIRCYYNELMASQIPSEIQKQKYILLTTFRKNGAGVATPVWFGEEGGKLYVMTVSTMGKTKRVRNNPQVKVAPCTIRGKVTCPEFSATARILPAEEQKHARHTINRKYLMARLTSPFSRADVFLEISF